MKIECSGTALIDAVTALGPQLDYTRMGSLRREKMCQPANNIDTGTVTWPLLLKLQHVPCQQHQS